jgi:D-arginine dehydrogenase
MAIDCDVAVIGAGIAGASAAAHLAETHKVVVLEMEERPGYHSTGRSAAMFEPNYGPAPIRALTRAARAAFAEMGAFTPRETIFFMMEGQQEAFEALMAAQVGMHEIAVAEAQRKYPLLRAGNLKGAILDPGTADMDVDLIHQHYLRKFRSHGGKVLANHGVTALERQSGKWRIAAGGETFVVNSVVNAAGAWGDRVAALAGAKPVGLQPKRRSMAVVPMPEGHDLSDWPMIGDVGETWYSKAQSGKLLVSPADATPVDPHDAFADDMALAEGIDRFQQAVTFEVTRVEHSWGGLRSFVADGDPVAGFDPDAEGFFWLVGQGGYGIQTSPALSRVAAALVRGEDVPADIAGEGFEAASLSPARLR